MNDLLINLLASAIFGSALWSAQWLVRLRRLARRRAFFGLARNTPCLIAVSRHAASPLDDSVDRQDLSATIEVAVLVRECGAVPDLLPLAGEGRGIGKATEFCIGGPHANRRTIAHLKSCLPGVSFRPYMEDADGVPIFVGSRAFRRKRGSEEFTLVARVVVMKGQCPLWLIYGQTARANHAAVRYLAAEYQQLDRRYSSGKSFCILLRLVDPDNYGLDQIELTADVTERAFTQPSAAQ